VAIAGELAFDGFKTRLHWMDTTRILKVDDCTTYKIQRPSIQHGLTHHNSAAGWKYESDHGVSYTQGKAAAATLPH
jgi:hypothetical protein